MSKLQAEDLPIGTRLVNKYGVLVTVKVDTDDEPWFISNQSHWMADEEVQELIDEYDWKPAPWPAGSVFEVEGER